MAKKEDQEIIRRQSPADAGNRSSVRKEGRKRGGREKKRQKSQQVLFIAGDYYYWKGNGRSPNRFFLLFLIRTPKLTRTSPMHCQDYGSFYRE